MTNKTMPEQIWARRDTVVDSWGGTVEEGWHTEPWFDSETKYVRADLVQGDANEPLADGQYRWVYLGKTWHVAFVFKNLMGEGFSFELGNIERGENDIEKVGPVVKPPEDA